MQHDRKAGGFDPQHRLGEQVARDALHQIFRPQAAVSALTATAVGKATFLIVEEATP